MDVTAAASGEVVFDLLTAMRTPLDAQIATCLYTAIVTDTGGFKYGNTTAKVMGVSARLISAARDPEYIFKQLYEEQPLCQVMLQADALRQTQLSADGAVAWSVVTRELLNRHGALDEHIDGLLNASVVSTAC